MALVLSAGAVSANNGKGPPGAGIVVDNLLYRTVGTPTDFSGTGAPAGSYDTIYALGEGLYSVASSAPGDSDFNGGRWMVFEVVWTNTAPVQLTSEEQVLAYEDAGMIEIDGPIKYFECPVIPPGQPLPA
jgi:hypothetical protein